MAAGKMADETARSILIVDDDDALRSVVQDILQEEGYRVLTARSTSGAVNILETERVALVLLDHVMPSRDDAAREALARSDIRRPPIVLFSAVADAEAVAATLGAEAWLQKPFEIEELLAVVRRYAPTDAQT